MAACLRRVGEDAWGEALAGWRDGRRRREDRGAVGALEHRETQFEVEMLTVPRLVSGALYRVSSPASSSSIVWAGEEVPGLWTKLEHLAV